MAKLLLKFNGAVIREIPLDKPQLTVGRKEANDVVIDNPAISGRHCRFQLADGVVTVEDLDSTNGTFVNDKRVLKLDLKHNDVVVLAKHSLVFIDEPPPPPAPQSEPAREMTQPLPDKTTKITPEEMEKMRLSAARSAVGDGARMGGLRVLKGGVDATEYELKGLSTYLGKAERAQVRIRSAGFFSGAPDVAASVHRRAEGYVLVALEPGYPKVNGAAVSGQALLKDGDIIECGGTTLQFFLKA